MNIKSLQPGNGYRLPPEAYYDQQWFDREQQDLFPSIWNFACTTDALPAPGCYVSVQIGHYPIVLVHQEDGSILGFHNSCRHRGALQATGLADAQGKRHRSESPMPITRGT